MARKPTPFKATSFQAFCILIDDQLWSGSTFSTKPDAAKYFKERQNQMCRADIESVAEITFEPCTVTVRRD